jgi:hypothetical protein
VNQTQNAEAICIRLTRLNTKRLLISMPNMRRTQLLGSRKSQCSNPRKLPIFIIDVMLERKITMREFKPAYSRSRFAILRQSPQIWKRIVIAACIVSFVLLFRSSTTFVVDEEYISSVFNSTLGVSLETTDSSPILNSRQFGDIFVINLPERTDRRDALTLQSSVSDIKLSWIDGVVTKTIPDKAYPPGTRKGLAQGAFGSWRAHMNAIRT